MALDNFLPRDLRALSHPGENDDADDFASTPSRIARAARSGDFDELAGARAGQSVTLWDEVAPEIQRAIPDTAGNSPDE